METEIAGKGHTSGREATESRGSYRCHGVLGRSEVTEEDRKGSEGSEVIVEVKGHIGVRGGFCSLSSSGKHPPAENRHILLFWVGATHILYLPPPAT